MKVALNVFIFLLIMGLPFACQEDVSKDSFVDSSLQQYFDSFLAEAELRGLDLNEITEQVSGEFADLEDHVVGQCAKLSDGKREIRISTAYWARANSLEREYLVFHELGHCVLDREHDDSAHQGICTSIMNSGTSRCRNNYNLNTRKQLLDELFDY